MAAEDIPGSNVFNEVYARHGQTMSKIVPIIGGLCGKADVLMNFGLRDDLTDHLENRTLVSSFADPGGTYVGFCYEADELPLDGTPPYVYTDAKFCTTDLKTGVSTVVEHTLVTREGQLMRHREVSLGSPWPDDVREPVERIPSVVTYHPASVNTITSLARMAAHYTRRFTDGQ